MTINSEYPARGLPSVAMETNSCEEMAIEYGTPFFLYDADHVCRRIADLRRVFDNKVGIYFAVKANPNLELLRSLQPHVDGLDISSAGELRQAILAGYDGSCMSFAGPGKSKDELLFAVDNHVAAISVESERELRDIIEICKHARKIANIAIRVNPGEDSRAYGLRMGGRAVQFGVEEDQLANVLHLAKDNADCLNLRGLHVYAGSQGFDVGGVAKSVLDTLRIAGDLERLSGSRCEFINLGGGFGVSQAADDRTLDTAALAAQILPAIDQMAGSSGSKRKIVFELGRYLVADAGVYFARVISTKWSFGKYFAVADGGLHHHLAAAGMFGVGLRSNYDVRNVSRPDAEVIECSVAGPSCNPTDLLGSSVKIPKPEVGDLLAVMKSGSYGLTASPVLFLGRRTPAEIVVSGGTATLGRQPRDVTEFN